jgi:formylglycine-generating enzyme required for sulfatase activity
VRLALVIANGEYASFDRLAQTAGDGATIAAALTATGFADASGSGEVQVRRNLTLAAMQAEIAAFRDALSKAGPGAFGVLYYSGHGAAAGEGGDVMMVPIDTAPAELARLGDLSRAAVTRELMRSGVRTVLMVLDMCRNAVTIPQIGFAAVLDADAAGDASAPAIPGSKGLRRVLRASDNPIGAEQGYLVAYSTSANSVAFDNGVFSKLLAEEIRRPRQNIAEAMKRVSDRVAVSSGSQFQKPTFDYGLQGQPPCFVSCDPEAGNRFYDCANCPWMVTLPAGSSWFGSPASEAKRGKDEFMQSARTIARGFALAVFELTVAEWIACVSDGACRKVSDWSKENPNPLLPASGISYADAEDYLRWLSARSGRNYRLPTEEEWEYGSRARAPTAFPWGAGVTPSDANYDHTGQYMGSPRALYRGYPEAVNAYPPNAFGLYQMQGNVWEWTSGCIDPGCTRRVLRGGSFQSVPAELRSANRFALPPARRRPDVGLRVARDLDPDEVGGQNVLVADSL